MLGSTPVPTSFLSQEVGCILWLLPSFPNCYLYEIWTMILGRDGKGSEGHVPPATGGPGPLSLAAVSLALT